jgi:putative peptidoglycan lipid II flippase
LEEFALILDSYLKFARGTILRLISVKSSRGVSFTLTALSILSKPLGYARTLIIAWAFGTSPGMDSYHLANGIITLFTGSISQTLESALLPELARVREETGGEAACRSVASLISWLIIALTAILTAALVIAPGVLVRFFAGGFDAERIRMGAVMLWWMIPFAIATMYRPMLEIWSVFTERYTISSVVSTLFNFIAIPALLLSIPFIGVYSVAFSMSATNTILLVLIIAAMKGIPMRLRWNAQLRRSVVRVVKNSFFTVIIMAAGTLYVVVDRYFASRLPAGSVAAISYSALIFGLIASLANTPMNFFLSRISKQAASDRDEAARTLEGAITLTMAYLVPASAFIIAASKPLVSLIFGWGSFGEESVAMTSVCLAAYCVGLSFAVAASFVYRYALVLQKLGTIMVLTYVLVAVNALLDWALMRHWGLFGLSIATSFAQTMSFILYYLVVVGRALPEFLIRVRLGPQIALSGVMALLAWSAGKWSGTLQLALSAALFLLYLAAAEKIGLMPGVPPHWRPSKLAEFLLSAAKSYIMPAK